MNLTTSTGLTEAVASATKSLTVAREALAKAATEGSGRQRVEHCLLILATTVNAVATKEGALHTYNLALGVVLGMVETHVPEEKRPQRLLSVLISQTTRTEDTWSGRRNDTRRAFEDGVRMAVREISDAVVSLGKGDIIA